MLDVFKDKYFSVLGDSLSTLAGYTEPDFAVFYDTDKKLASGIYTQKDTWWGTVIEKSGGRLLVNNSFSGSTVCSHPLYEIQSYACSDERTSSLGRDGVLPDVIMAYIGTNDWGRGVAIDGDGTPFAGGDPTTFSAAYDRMLEKLKSNYPKAEIWCFTLAKSKFSANGSFEFPYCYGGRHISEYCEAVRRSAKKYGCRIIDLYNTAQPYDTIDGFHATREGMKTIADAVFSAVENI